MNYDGLQQQDQVAIGYILHESKKLSFPNVTTNYSIPNERA